MAGKKAWTPNPEDVQGYAVAGNGVFEGTEFFEGGDVGAEFGSSEFFQVGAGGGGLAIGKFPEVGVDDAGGALTH